MKSEQELLDVARSGCPFEIERTIDEWQCFHTKDVVFFIKIEVDQDLQNPLEDCDGMGHIYSLSNRHINHNPDLIEETLKKHPERVVTLSYFEHGLCLWDVQGGESISRCPDMRWDGVDYAGAWICDSVCLDEARSAGRKAVKELKASKPTATKEEIQDTRKHAFRERMVEMAGEACKSYTSFCNGDGYGFSTEAYQPIMVDDEICEDYDEYEQNGIQIGEGDSCWGFLGDEGITYLLCDYVYPFIKRMLGEAKLPKSLAEKVAAKLQQAQPA